MERAPSSLPRPSSQARCPNHLVPRHTKLPKRRMPEFPSTGKEIFKCNQSDLPCFIYFFPGEIHLLEGIRCILLLFREATSLPMGGAVTACKTKHFLLFRTDVMIRAWAPRAPLIETASFKLLKLGCEKRVPSSPFLPDWTDMGALDGRLSHPGSLTPTSCRNPAQLSPDLQASVLPTSWSF